MKSLLNRVKKIEKNNCGDKYNLFSLVAPDLAIYIQDFGGRCKSLDVEHYNKLVPNAVTVVNVIDDFGETEVL